MPPVSVGNKFLHLNFQVFRKMSNLKVEFPFEINDLPPDINAELLTYFHGERTGFVQVGPEKYFFPNKYKQEAAAYYNFESRSDDIWVVTFPRSGTTFTQELVWLVANNLDFVTAKKKFLTERFPFFEFSVFMHPKIKAEMKVENAHNIENLKFIEQIERPGYEFLNEIDTNQRRFIKTHFPFSLLPPSVLEKQCKIIYVARNPRDVAVSYYHLNRLFRTQGYVGDFPRYWNYFERGLNPWMPYYSHLKEAMAHRHLPNVLFLNYEDMLADLDTAIQSITNFLDCKVDADGIENLKNHLNIANFRLNTAVNCDEMRTAGILNKGEANFVRTGCIHYESQSEFFENAKLLDTVNLWIEQQKEKIGQ